ncbi:hypothetical protein CsSME_00028376 [Camellia sinensis var. sinensis]
MTTPAISGGTSLFSGLTRLCKGLAVVLVGGHIVVQILPSSLTYLALIPARFFSSQKNSHSFRGLLISLPFVIIPIQNLSFIHVWIAGLRKEKDLILVSHLG